MKKTKPDGNKTIYPSTLLRAGSGGIYEVDKSLGGSVKRTVTYYPAAGAMRIVDSTGNNLYYTLKDHLGSASVVTDSTGAIVSGSDQRYYPYGESRLTGTMLTDKLFTGQREMMGLGIYHYGARFYSPKLGRFLSADTIVPGAANPQAYNRYSYVLNNPLRYTDPTGHYCVGDDEDCADEGGDGPASTGTGGNNGNGGGGGGNPHDDDDVDPNPNCIGCTIPTLAPPSSSPPDMWDAFSAVGDIAEGGFFASLSIYALVASCFYGRAACIITAPIFFTMAVLFTQHGYNGIQAWRQLEDPSVEATGREVVDFVFPFLNRQR